MTKKCSWAGLTLFLTTFFMLSSCNVGTPPTQTTDPTIGLANPATTKCLKDGYLSQPIMTNGVPTGGVCFDKVNHKACEEWAYFRDECKLGPIASTLR